MAIQEHTPGSPEVSVASTGMEAPTSRTAPLLSLEIRRGKTKHPTRPVYSPNFLIGSGAHCDLRLGGNEIPEAYAAILADASSVRLQWLAEGPQLLLNGNPVQEADLRDGDLIGFGAFEFLVHRPTSQENAEPDGGAPSSSQDSPDVAVSASLMRLVSEAKTTEAEGDLSEQSAEELADHLEAEQQQVEDFQAAVRMGEEVLLFTAAQRAADLSEETLQPNNSPAERDEEETEPDAEEAMEGAILEELERVVRQLNGFSSELDERAARLTDQETTQAEAAELLLEAQNELAAQLERFHQQITENQNHEPAPPKPKLRKAA